MKSTDTKGTDGVVKNGVVVTPPSDKDAYVTCDRCGRKFLGRYTYCICKG